MFASFGDRFPQLDPIMISRAFEWSFHLTHGHTFTVAAIVACVSVRV